MKNKTLILFTIVIAIFNSGCGNSNFKISDISSNTKNTTEKNILIIGATKGTGLEAAKQLVARGDKVTAFVRPTSNLSQLENLDISYIKGDALNRKDLDQAISKGPFDAIITTLGCFKCKNPPDYIGNKNLFEAAEAANNLRIIMVSTIGVGASEAGIPWIAKRFLKDVIPLKQQAEDALVKSKLQYTIFRPGALKNAEATGKGIATEDPRVIGVITRADLAMLILQAIDNPKTVGKIYSAIDKDMVWPWGMLTND